MSETSDQIIDERKEERDVYRAALEKIRAMLNDDYPEWRIADAALAEGGQ